MSYKKILSGAGVITALVAISATSIILTYPIPKSNEAGFEVDLRQAADMTELRDKWIGTQVLEDCSIDEYNKTLFEDWGFTGSKETYTATEEIADYVDISDDKGQAGEAGQPIEIASTTDADTKTDAGETEQSGLSQSTDGSTSTDDTNDGGEVSNGAETNGVSGTTDQQSGEGTNASDPEQKPVIENGSGDGNATGNTTEAA